MPEKVMGHSDCSLVSCSPVLSAVAFSSGAGVEPRLLLLLGDDVSHLFSSLFFIPGIIFLPARLSRVLWALSETEAGLFIILSCLDVLLSCV